MFDAYVGYHGRLRPTAPAILTPGGAVSFARLDADVTRTAGLLRTMDAGPERPVAVDIDDPYLAWLVTLALARLGVPSAPGADHCCPLRVAERAEAEPTLLIGTCEVAAMLSGPVPLLPPVEPDADALGRILLSSGTTGEAKRIALSWRAIDAGIRNVPIAYGAPPGPWLMATGLHTILGFVMTLGAWGLGRPVLMGQDAPLAMAQVLALRPGLMAMTPGQLARLLDELPAGHAPFPIRVLTGGGPVPPALLARTRRLLTDDLLSVYGASECGAVAVADAALLAREPAAAGIVLPGVTVGVVDDDGRAVALGDLGHVRIRSDRVALGYLGGEAGGFEDGWFRPGDLGRLDGHGLLRLEGRADDLMNLRGQKVLPAWIEAAAQTVPGVAEAAAFSLADDDGWERCWIAVVASDAFSEPALAKALAPLLPDAGKISWLKVERLPRNPMGKIERNRLREQARAVMAGWA